MDISAGVYGQQAEKSVHRPCRVFTSKVKIKKNEANNNLLIIGF